MDLLVVARSSKDRHHVVLRWGIHYGVVEKGMKPSQVKWGKKDILEGVLGKGFDEVDPPVVFKPTVKKSLNLGLSLYLDLFKGHQLNFGHLIKRAVQVTGKNGKTFTRMQWVNPGQASTGHGVRRINNSKDWINAIGDGVVKHPLHKQALEDQAVDMDKHHVHGEHPPFYVPETAESRKGKEGRDFIPHKDSDFSRKYQENQATKSEKETLGEKKGIIRTEVAELLRDYNANESLAPIFDSLESMHLKGTTREKYLSLRGSIEKHWKSVQPVVEKSITSSNSSDYAKKLQLSTLERISKMSNSGLGLKNKELSILSSHPSLARYTVDRLLGVNRANVLRAHMKKGNITININQKSMDNILTSGYVSNTSEGYLKSVGSQQDIETYKRIASDTGSTRKKLSMLQDVIDESEGEGIKAMWSNVVDRAEAEYECMGLDMDDDLKPIYMAFNPDGSTQGACVSYGDGASVKIDESALKDCTGNISDTLYHTRPIAKIHSIDHLRDIYMLRMMHDAEGGGDIFRDIPEWANGAHMWSNDVPVELHYHKSVIDPKIISINGTRQGNINDGDDEDGDKYSNWG